MSAAEQLKPHARERLSWIEICGRHPNEWVCLVDLQCDADGSIVSAVTITNGKSIRQALQAIGATHPESTVVHTGGRPLRLPRIEMTDEIRNVVRTRR